MKKSSLIFFVLCLVTAANAQDIYKEQRGGWLQKAEESKPPLIETIKQPVTLVTLVQDDNVFQHWKAVKSKPVDSLYNNSFKKQSGVVVDFGEHLTGYFTFSVEELNRAADAPLRIKFTFGEVPSELATPFDPYPGGLSRAWLQDEIITISDVPSTITIPRRFAFCYVKMELLGSSVYSDFRITNVSFKASTSVNTTPGALAATTNKMIGDIDRIGLTTLKECMQTVYEDGPKRDRRLWIGDLYLESLANIYSYKNYALTKHCLYLLAGLSYEDGVAPSNVFERPKPHPQINPLFDYALIYDVAVKEYVQATGDKQTALDLWPLIKQQLEIPKKYLGEDGMLDYEKANKEWWLFFDWRNGLDKQAALQGVVIWAYKNTYELAKMIGKENEVAELPALVKKMTDATHKNLYDKTSGVFVSGKDNQVSYASQAWMVLSGVATKVEGATALKKLPTMQNVVYPGAPYLYHYVIEAMIQCDLKQEAKELLTNYWGGMVNKGADTFWEVYDPKDDFLSPYKFFPVNSYCHAWSCTPVYFIRKYPEIFQQ
ncbi:Bacterial alpha-L-rhamnosidase [Panacibacter ginsenosidivorans]|uniref:Bacterial alpha-L-rhamnosidase n=1 Tax=Panacibacter ginsenosidivorans TaxID=1813871 RepID=A0A5B8VDW1_9BACT|nr:family 78 glycoside hydrolase catalytic domain [Panacibacter ginsenosidivorans]QEC69171.1 Bacterial alpha-L-rhamnosidase [Panacibacter ginsenosidivorans]